MSHGPGLRALVSAISSAWKVLQHWFSQQTPYASSRTPTPWELQNSGMMPTPCANSSGLDHSPELAGLPSASPLHARLNPPCHLYTTVPTPGSRWPSVFLTKSGNHEFECELSHLIAAGHPAQADSTEDWGGSQWNKEKQPT